MPQRPTSYFSTKALLSSILIGLLTLGLIVFKGFSETQKIIDENNLNLTVQTGEPEIKFPYEKNFQKAQKGQEIFAQSSLRTGAGQEAELQLGPNLIALDQNTELRFLENNTTQHTSYLQESPRLSFELIKGAVWIKASDSIEFITPRANTNFVHSAGLLSYQDSNNKILVLEGDAALTLKNQSGKWLADFILPLNNQITFLDQQITDDYGSLKASKLKKELKMISFFQENVEEGWLKKYVVEMNKIEGNTPLEKINSAWVYHLKSVSQKFLSSLNFFPPRDKMIRRNETELQLAYLLGGLNEKKDQTQAKELLANLQTSLDERQNEDLFPLFYKVLSELQETSENNSTSLLKTALLAQMSKADPAVLRIALTDLRRALETKNLKDAEEILKNWQQAWKENSAQTHLEEYSRQTQILQNTLLGHGELISITLLNILDEGEDTRMALDLDKEETRFEVAQERLQIVASLINHYQYSLAKQYLKNSYLSLDIEVSNPKLASTQVFLSTGILLAQKIDYALTSLHGVREPIDQLKFMKYLEAKRQEKALVEDLKSFLEVDTAESSNEPSAAAPSFKEINERFEKAGIKVSEVYVKSSSSNPLVFEITNAIIPAQTDRKGVQFQGLYDSQTNTLTEVQVGEKKYKTAFALEDLARFLTAQTDLNSSQDADALKGSIDTLLSDQEKLKTQEDKALARDLAIKFAVTQLTAAGVEVSDLKSNLDVLDADTLETVQVKNASVSFPTESTPVLISFIYSTKTFLVTDVRGQDGTLLLSRVALKDLLSQVKQKLEVMKKNSQTVKEFMSFASKNELSIVQENIHPTPEGNLELKDLELKSAGLKVTGLYDPKTFKFISVEHPLLTSKDIDFKVYFEDLVKAYIVDAMAKKQILVATEQITAVYPFTIVQLKSVVITDSTFNFNLDLKTLQPSNILHLETGVSLGKMTFQELKIYVVGLNSNESSGSSFDPE